MGLFGNKKVIAYVCGHVAQVKGTIIVRGEERQFQSPAVQNGRPPFCFDCIIQMCIQCAHCGWFN